MATASQTYGSQESTGVTVLVTCGVLSLTSVVGILIILGISAVRSCRSPDKTLFVRTQAAIYFFSLLICDLIQAVGTLFNIAWFFNGRVEIGTACTAQATIVQLGNVGIAIFSSIIAAHAFSLLFLRRQWSDRACHIVLIVSWGLLVLNSCIGYFVVTSAEKGPYYGISGYWCGVTPAYRAGRYASEYLLLLVSAAFSFILSSLVFLRLRGNITVSAGHKIHFYYRPNAMAGGSSDETFVVTDDQRAETHLSMVAKQMQRHPIAYTVLVLPICAISFYPSAPFPATVSTLAMFVLSGFVNVILFCSSCKTLPGHWKQKFGLSATSYSPPDGSDLPNRANVSRRLTKTGGKTGARQASVALGVTVEKDVNIKYDETEPGTPYPTFSRISLPIETLRARDTSQKDDPYPFYLHQISFPPPLRIKLDGNDPNQDLSAGAHAVDKVNKIAWDVSQPPVHPSKRHESSMCGPALDSEAPRVYLLDMPPSVKTNPQKPLSPSVSASRMIANQIYLPRPDVRSNASDNWWTGHNLPPQVQYTELYRSTPP